MNDPESPISIFEAYEQDLLQSLRGIKAKLDAESSTFQADRGNAERCKATLRKVELELDEADDLFSQMQLTLQAVPKSIKPPYSTRLNNAKAELTRCKNTSRTLHSSVTASEGLIPKGYSRGNASDNPYGNERQRLLAGTATLNDGSRRILDSQRIALESEEQGADILRTLRVQREQIENSRSMLNNADNSIDRASGTLKKMIQQMYRQRVILSLIAVFLIAVVVLILYFKLFRH
ncbi:hypothetical protein ONZ45_g7606 [Pleurotus djamor]|nr:hypothetical protein ONZ45_g7606 [Pleurotus djamor]